jgi:hypothetical protein
MRRLVSMAFGAVLVLVLAGPTSAAPTPIEERRERTDVPLGTYDLTLPSDFCGFELSAADIAGRITYVFITEDRHGNVLERVIFHTVTRYTNLDTGEWFEKRFDSVGNYLTRPDGSTRLIGRNDVLAWYLQGEPADLGAGVWLIDHGRLIEEFDADGNVIRSDYQHGEILDVCAALS